MSQTSHRSVRFWEQNGQRLDYAAKLGLNVSEVVNAVLDKHLKSYLEHEKAQREQQMREVLRVPVP